MIYNQKIEQASRTRLHKHLLIGATSVVAAGALLGVGVAGASAATVQPTPIATHILSNRAVAAALPANLTSDLTALKDASSANAVAQAQHITSTALAGGYGVQPQKLAADLDFSGSAVVGSTSAGVSAGTTVGAQGSGSSSSAGESAQRIQELVQHPLSGLSGK